MDPVAQRGDIEDEFNIPHLQPTSCHPFERRGPFLSSIKHSDNK